MERTEIGSIDAAAFLRIWQHFDADGNGYIEGKELDLFFRHLLASLGFGSDLGDKELYDVKSRFMEIYDVTSDGKLQLQEVANMILPEEENFLLLFRRENPLGSSVEFMRNFLGDLCVEHHRDVTSGKLDEYTDSMMKLFDRNQDGRLDLTDMARILSLQDNFLLQFRMEAMEDSGMDQRRADFEKIFAHYDVSKTGELEGPEVDGFVKDMIGLVKPNMSGTDLDQFREVLMEHCDLNRDGKIQKTELALCLGLRFRPLD
ncbi:secretagogin-like isoform X2 [Lethenteron reissneri]|uniref:secretagogin-like isoform X2 n=1 Tax=Lethenteron reissneri TaxID=7753 RepID=UPI002AB6778C|nr:secretagogin-like isoform X2 [Lethenteron reissneri]